MTTNSPDLSPLAIAPHINEMWWPELDQLAEQILSRMSLVAEGSSASLGARVSSGKPASTIPTGDASLRDEWADRLAQVVADELRRAYAAQAEGLDAPDPKRYRQTIMRAAIALENRQRGPAKTSDRPNAEDAGPERVDWIVQAYEGLEAHDAAAIESGRAGWISAEAVRRIRHRNGRHRTTGMPKPSGPAEIRDSVLAAHRLDPTRTERDIATELDLAKSTVHFFIAEAAKIA